jgi:putative ABC transport system permease protein
MIRNYLTSAFRNLSKHKVFSFINIFGLAIGIAACVLILQYVNYELSYDRFQQNSGRIYRVQLNRFEQGKISTQWAAGNAGVGPDLKRAFPEVEAFAKLHHNEGVFSYKDRKFREDRLYFVNDAFLPMFSYRAIRGKLDEALIEPNTAVVTASIAKKYFNLEDPIGKVLSLDKQVDLKITAVVADPPPNTHLKFDILASFPTFVKMTGPEADTQWDWDGFLTYLLLKPGTDPKILEKKIAGFVKEKYKDNPREKVAPSVVLVLQPVKDIHLYSHFMFEAEPNGNGSSVYFLGIIALFIIIIAWINYINLSTARSIERAKEVGVRKVMGSYKSQLISQFMFESLLINFLAVLLAFILVLACLPLFNILAGKEVSFSMLRNPRFWLGLFTLFIFGTLLSGLYPAFVLSSFRPIEVLKGRILKTKHGAFLRQSLVILQFAASVALMVGTFGVYRQLNYMQKQDLGVQIDQTLVLRGPSVTDSTYQDKLNTFRTEMLRTPGFSSISASTSVPGSKVEWNAGGIHLRGTDPNQSNQYRVIGIDYDFIDAYGLKVLAGRNFSKKFSTDSGAVMLNEAALKLMGFNKPEQALSRQIDFWGKVYSIVGVVSNHHQESLREAYDAHIFRLIPDANNFYSLKLQHAAKDPSSLIRAAERQWIRLFPGNPFDYFFLDEHYARQYRADQQFEKTFGLFAVLAIFVSCLGLLGLASFITTQRTKEIGIRKVSGASVSNILILLTKDFMRPVFASFLIAFPITYILLNRWLQDYAFKISVNVWMFILPGLLILLVAVLTVSFQAIKSALSNPVKSLRTD